MSKKNGDSLPVWGNPNMIYNQCPWCILSRVDPNYNHSERSKYFLVPKFPSGCAMGSNHIWRSSLVFVLLKYPHNCSFDPSNAQVVLKIKLRCSEKATKFEKISQHVWHNVKKIGRRFFSKYFGFLWISDTSSKNILTHYARKAMMLVVLQNYF